MKLSVVIPVYNEKNTLRALVQRVRAVPIDKEIILIDDCSIDGTRDLLKQLQQREPDLKIIFHEYNQGKGAAVQDASSAKSKPMITRERTTSSFSFRFSVPLSMSSHISRAVR